MKKLVTMMLGLGLILGSASFAFGEDAPKDTTKTTTKKAKKAKKSKKTDTTSTSEKKN